MKTISSLIKLGLHENEALAYIHLLEQGGSTAGSIAKHLGIKRTTMYGILDSLKQKHMVLVYYRGSKHFFYATSPDQILHNFQQKLFEFSEVIPLLSSLQKNPSKKVGLRFIETREELKDFYLSTLDEVKGKSYAIIGTESGWEQADPKFLKLIHKKLLENKIKLKILLSHDSPNTPHHKLRHVKRLPKGYTFTSTIDIFKDKIFIASPGRGAYGIVISVPIMTDIFNVIFKLLWDSSISNQ